MRSAVVCLAGFGLALLACSVGSGGGSHGTDGAENDGGAAGEAGSYNTGGVGIDRSDAGDRDAGNGHAGGEAGQGNAGHGAGHGGGGASGGGAGAGSGDDDGGDDAGDSGTVPVGCTVLPCPAPFEALFASEQLPSFYLTIPDGDGVSAPDSWTQLASCARADLEQDPLPAKCDYQSGSFHAEYDPDPLDSVSESIVTAEVPIGIRLKGRASFQPIGEKPGLKVKFSGGKAERFLGLSKLTLNNLAQDPSGIRERMAYRVYRDAGLEAPLANNARVYVKRGEAGTYEYYGLYSNVQTLDRRFVEYRFGEVGGAAGNLFDTTNDNYYTDFDRSSLRGQAGPDPGAQEQRFQLEINESVPDLGDLTAAIDAIYVDDIATGAGQFLASASPVIDVDQWLRVSAAEAMIADWDGFAACRNNYKAYHDLVRGAFVILPWGTDQTFGLATGTYRPDWQYAVDHSNSQRIPALFLQRCLRDGVDCGARYHEIVAEVAATFDAQALGDEAERASQQIDAAMLADTRRSYDYDTFQLNGLFVRHFIENRVACVEQQLSGLPCATGTCPDYETGCL